MKFSIIMSAWQPWEDIRKAVGCLFCQTYRDWELIVVSDGMRDAAVDLVIRAFHHYPRNRYEVVDCPRVPGIWGNRARRIGLDHCQGDYVVWINHDNIVFPDYLAAHKRNIDSMSGCISVVNLDCWVRMRYYGPFPVRPARLTKIDLMNFAMPLELARKVDAFGPEMEAIHHADWLTYDAATRHAPVVTVPETDVPVGIHF